MDIHRPGSRAKKLLFFILALLAVCLFQNCNPVHFSDFASQAVNVKSDNNGGGYWGKPDYYRFTPGFTCEQKESAVSVLHLGESVVTLTENQKLACQALTTTLDPKQVDHSSYQNEIVGYREGIFEGNDSVPEAIPANLVEVWCRDGKDTNEIETITHYDRISQQAVTRIYYSGASQPKLISDFSVARIVSFNLVTVQNQNGFQLQVFRDRPAQQLGLFSGELKAVIEGQRTERQMSCRLGGSVDPKLWPIPEIVDSNPIRFKWAPDFSMFAYTSYNSSNQLHLFASDPTGQNQMRLSLTSSQPLVVADFAFNPDMKSLTFWNNSASTGDLIYQAPLHNSPAAVPLNQQLVDGRTRFSTWEKFFLSKNGDRVVAEFSTLGQPGTSLWSVSLFGGPPLELSPARPSVNSTEVADAFDFKISKSQNRVAFFYGGYWPDLYMADVDGGNRIKVSLPLTSSEWFFLGANSNVQIPEPGNFAIVDAYTKDGPGAAPHFEYFAVSIDGMQVIPMPVNFTWRASSASGYQVLMTDPYGHLILFDLQTLKTIPLPNWTNAFFSKEKSVLFGTKAFVDGLSEPVAFYLSDLNSISLCSEAKGSPIQISEIDGDRVLISSFDSKAGQMNVYVKNASQPCQIKNSFPISVLTLNSSGVLQPGLSPDGNKVWLHVKGTGPKGAFDNLYFVPLDGKPAILVNAPVFSGATISGAQFLRDSKGLVFSGSQISPNRISVFYWQIP